MWQKYNVWNSPKINSSIFLKEIGPTQIHKRQTWKSWFLDSFKTSETLASVNCILLICLNWPTLLIGLVPEKLFEFVYCSDLRLNNSHFRKQSAPQATPAIISLFKLFKRFYSYWVNRLPMKYKLNFKTSIFLSV